MTMRDFHVVPSIIGGWAAVSLVFALTACGGGSASTPTSPTPSPAQRSVTAVQVAGSNAISAGALTQLSATAQWSDGSTEDVTTRSTWQSTNAAVATVNGSGQIRGLAPGTAEVSAAFQGQTGRTSVQVMAVDNVQRVIVAVTRLTVNGSCDHDSIFESPRDGEFDFSFELERSGSPVTPILTITGRTMAEGEHVFTNAVTFNRNVTRGEDFGLRFSFAEYDGVLGVDTRRSRGVSFTYQAGQWAPSGRSIIVDESEQCGAAISFTISSES